MGRPKKIVEEIVEVEGRKINATLTRKQRLALLAECIRSGTIKDSDLVRAILAYEELSNDDPNAQTYTLKIEDAE